MKTIPLPGYVQRSPKHIRFVLGAFAIGLVATFLYYFATLLPMFGLAATTTVTTDSATNITRTTATLNGTLNSTGGKDVTERGFDYGTTASYGTNVNNNVTAPFVYSSKFGAYGSGNGEFGGTGPNDIAVDASGNIYVSGPARVQKFDSAGNYVSQFGFSGSITFNTSFGVANRMAFDSAGNIYVTDYSFNRVVKYNSSGSFVSKFGSTGSGNGQFNGANGIAIDSSGNIYVADTNNHRIQKFNSAGTYVTKWGSNGTADGQMKSPAGLTLDASGNLYVAESAGSRIQKFNTSGTYISKFGTAGSGNGQFNGVQDVAFDSAGNIYTSESSGARIQKFNSAGTYVSKIISVGASGADGNFGAVNALTINSAGTMIFSDVNNYRAQLFTPNLPYSTGAYSINITGLTCGTTYHFRAYAVNEDDTGDGSDTTFATSACPVAPTVSTVSTSGITRTQAMLRGDVPSDGDSPVTARGFNYGLTGSYGSTINDPSLDSGMDFIRRFGSYGTGTDQFNYPNNVAVDADDNIYVVDRGNNRILKFDSDGYNGVAFGSSGSGNGQFSQPSDIVVDSLGNFYVTDSSNYRVQKFNSSFVYQSQITSDWGAGAVPYAIAIDASDNLYVTSGHRVQKFTSASNYTSSTEFGTNGTGDGQFSSPSGIGVATDGSIYVMDRGNNRVQKFNSSFVYQSQFGTEGSSNGQFQDPYALEVDSNGYVYVADRANNRIQRFTSSGVFDDKFVRYASGDEQSMLPLGIAINSMGDLWVTDQNHTVLRVRPVDFGTNFDLLAESLTCGTTYHYQAFATNAYGTGQGSDQTFTTSTCPVTAPEVSVQAADNLARTTARLNGTVTSFASSSVTERGFNYGLTTNYTGTVTVDGSVTTDAYDKDINGLTCGTTYHYRAFATNSAGTGQSADQTFTTSACPTLPEVTTQAADTITLTSANLNGTSTDFISNDITARGFQYGFDTSYGLTASSATESTDDFAAVANVLVCNTTYHYRAYATNTAGTSYGTDVTFTTPACPPQTDYGLTTTMVNSAPVSSGQTVTYRYSLTNNGPNATGYGTGGIVYVVLPAEFTLNSSSITYPNLNYTGTPPQCVDVGLISGNTAIASALGIAPYLNNRLLACAGFLGGELTGFDVGQTMTFDVSGTANTNFASGSTRSRAFYMSSISAEDSFNEIVYKNALNSGDTFSLPYNNVSVLTYGVEANQPPTVSMTAPTVNQQFGFGSDVILTASASDGDGSIDRVEFLVDGLQVGGLDESPYTLTASGLPAGNHTVVAVAYDNLGVPTSSEPRLFSVGNAPAIVKTRSPSVTTQTTAPLNGTVTTLGSSILTARGFQYGISTSYGQSYSDAVSAEGDYTQTITGLTCGTSYHYRAFATSVQGTVYGEDKLVTMRACGATPTVATNGTNSVNGTSKKLNGSISSIGDQYVRERGFRYGTTTSYGSSVHDAPPSQSVYEGTWNLPNLPGDIDYDQPTSLTMGWFTDVATDSSGNIYVNYGARISKFTPSGVRDESWGQDGFIDRALGVAIDSHDVIYTIQGDNDDPLIESGTGRIVKYDSNGNQIGEMLSGLSGTGIRIINDKIFILNDSVGIEVGLHTTGVYSLSGVQLDTLTVCGFIANIIDNCPDDEVYSAFDFALDIVGDNDGNIYVSLAEGGCEQCVVDETGFILKFGPDGGFLDRWDVGPHTLLWGLETDESNNVYVTATTVTNEDPLEYNGRVKKYSSDGDLLGEFGLSGSDEGQISNPSAITFSPLGDMLIVDIDSSNAGRVLKFKQYQDPSTYNLTVAGLTCATTYHYQAYATSSSGTGYGSDQTFTTANCALTQVPQVTTVGSSNIGKVDAELEGRIDSSLANITQNGFQFGTSTSYGSTVSADNPGYAYAGAPVVGQGGGGAFVAVDSDGNYFMVDGNAKIIRKYSSNGDLITEWGSQGNGNGQFQSAAGLDVDPDGNVYVADSTLGRVQKFDNDGNFIMKWGDENTGTASDMSSTIDVAIGTNGLIYVANSVGGPGLNGRTIKAYDYTTGTYVKGWGGTYGNGDGQFAEIYSLALDADNNVYVAESGPNYRVQKFDEDGNFITKWGGQGSDYDKFTNAPLGIAVSPSGEVYVSDTYGGTIKHFDTEGNYINRLEVGFPQGLFVDQVTGALTVINIYDGIKVFEPITAEANFTMLASELVCDTTYHYRAFAKNEIGTGYGEDKTFETASCIDESAPVVTTVGTYAVGGTNTRLLGRVESDPSTITLRGFQYGIDTNYGTPVEIGSPSYAYAGNVQTEFGAQWSTTDSEGNYYVSYGYACKVVKYDPQGNEITEWGSEGSGDGQFRNPMGIATDPDNNVYVADPIAGRIQKFDSDGNFIMAWGNENTGTVSDMSSPIALAIGSDGLIYVTNREGPQARKVKVYNYTTGAYVRGWGGTYGSGNGQFQELWGIALDSANNVYVTETEPNARVQKFDSQGNFILKWGEPGPAYNQFGGTEGGGPRGIAVSSNDEVYVADPSNYSVKRFHPNGTFINKFGGQGGLTQNGGFDSIYGLSMNKASGAVSTIDMYRGVSDFQPIPPEADFVIFAEGLTCNTTYHFRAFAVNAFATGYGEDMAFQTTNDCGGGGGNNERPQTDFSLTKTLATPGPILAGQEVKYRIKVTNVGDTTAPYRGNITDFLPNEFTLASTVITGNSQVECASIGKVGQSIGQGIPALDRYSELEGVVCGTDPFHDGGTLLPGQSIEFDINGTANADFTSQSTKNRAIFISANNEDSFMNVLGTFLGNYDGQSDLFELPNNNIAVHTYVASSNPNPSSPPRVQITAPTNRQVFGAKTTSVVLAADASSDTSTIDRVEFFVDGVYIGTVTQPPYSITALGLPAGSHTLLAKTYDVLGGSAISEPVVFFVQPVIGPPITTNAGTPTTTTDTGLEELKNSDNYIAPREGAGGLDAGVGQRRNFLDITLGHKLFRGVPLLLVLLLIIMALLYTRQAFKEYELNARTQEVYRRYVNTLQATNDYLAITSHYLNTPVAIMNGAIELVASLKLASEPTITHLQSILLPFSQAVERALVENQTSASQTRRDELKLKPKTTNPFKDRAVWVPASIVLLCLITANILLINVNVLTNSLVRMSIEFGLFFLALLLLAFSKYYKDYCIASRELTSQQLVVQSELVEKRRAFIDTTKAILDKYYEDLELAGGRIKAISQSKLYFNGLAMIATLRRGLVTIYRTTDMKAEAPLFAITAFMHKQVKDAETKAKEHNVTLHTDIKPGVSARIQPQEITQLVSSILDNAIKFSQEGGKVEIRARRRFSKVVISVSDHGIGISNERLQQLFEPFSRASDTMRYDYEGSGLNLYIDKVIAARLGGNIALRSSLGKGTTVTVTLPAASAQASLVAPDVISPEPNAQSGMIVG